MLCGAAAAAVAIAVVSETTLQQLPAAYGIQLYGTDAGPTDLATIDAVDITLLGAIQRLIAHSFTPSACPKHVGDLQWPALPNGHYWPPCLARVRHPPPHAAGAGWTEVMRRVLTVSPENTTPPAAWFYHARGSGIWIDVGATAVYADHNDACANLLNASWPQCTYAAVWAAAMERGLTSIQYTHHCDRNCGCDLGEIVMLNASGLTSCPVPMRTGRNATRPCACSNSASVWVNCGREWPSTCNPWALQWVAVAIAVLATSAMAMLVRLHQYERAWRRKQLTSSNNADTTLLQAT